MAFVILVMFALNFLFFVWVSKKLTRNIWHPTFVSMYVGLASLAVAGELYLIRITS